MLITDCPWCDGAAVITETLDCEACGVQVELVEDASADIALAA